MENGRFHGLRGAHGVSPCYGDPVGEAKGLATVGNEIFSSAPIKRPRGTVLGVLMGTLRILLSTAHDL